MSKSTTPQQPSDGIWLPGPIPKEECPRLLDTFIDVVMPLGIWEGSRLIHDPDFGYVVCKEGGRRGEPANVVAYRVVPPKVTCTTCSGRGIVRRGNGIFVVQTACPTCDGAGYV